MALELESATCEPVSPTPPGGEHNGKEDNQEVVPAGPSPAPKEAQPTTKAASFSQTFSNATGYDFLLMALGTLGALVTGVSIPAFNILFGSVLDALNDDPDSFTDEINRLCLSFLIISVANLLTGFLQVYCWSATGERQTQRFRERYVNALLAQEIGWFDTVGAGQLSTKVAEVVNKIQDGTGRKIGDLLQYVAQVIASLAVAFYLCWQLTVVLLAAIPCIGLAGSYMIQSINAATHQSFTQYAQAGAVAHESISAVRTVNAFNLQPVFISKYRVFILEAMHIGVDKGINVGLGNGAVFGAAFLTYALGFWYGGNLVADDVERDCEHDCMTGGRILTVFFSAIMGSLALGQIAPPLTAFTTARASIGVIYELLERKPLIDGLSNQGIKFNRAEFSSKIKGEVTMKDVTFAYPSRPEICVCDGISLKISVGETVALVGASGCGKSTIVNLLLRFYDPQKGAVSIDGIDVRELNIKFLRSFIGYVGQEPILFAGTIGDNIAYGLDPEERERLLNSSLPSSSRGDSDAGPKSSRSQESGKNRAELMERVIAAAKAANAHDFIMGFPNGYDTDVGSSGSALSGGQKQRIAIARALIKKPVILLLDEATSALDVHSEKIVQQSIDRLAQSKAQTTIIIAHRLSTIVNADRICVLRDGTIVEQGPHSELIKNENGVYSDLVRMQMMSGEEEMKEDVVEVNEKRKPSVSPDDKAVAVAEAEIPVAAEVKPDETVDKEEKKKIMSRIFAMIKQYPGYCFVGLAGALFFGALFPCWGLMLAKTQTSFFLEDAGEIRDRSALYAYFYILLAGVAFFGSLSMFYGVVAVGEHIAAEIRSTLFESYFHHSISFFDDPKNSVGHLTTQLADDTRLVSKALGEGFARQLQAFATLIIAIALGFQASWVIALIVLGTFPLNIIASSIQMAAVAGMQYDHEDDEKAVMNEQQKKAGEKKGNASSGKAGKTDAKKGPAAPGTSTTMSGSHSTVLGTAFTNMRTVSAFSMQHKVSEHYSSMTQKIAAKRTNRSIAAGLGFGGSNTCLFLTYALLFWVGAKLIRNGTINFENLMTAILTLMLGAVGLGQALNDMGDQVKGVSTAKKIFNAVDSARSSTIDGLASNKGAVPLKSTVALLQNRADEEAPLQDDEFNAEKQSEIYELKGKIELRDVYFRYPSRPDVEVCKGYNLTIQPGEVVAFVGPSGSGKSTIINLLLRFYDPDRGQIFVDDMDMRSLNLRYLRSQIGYVGQEPVLFSGTVHDNLSYGRYNMNFTPLLSLPQAMSIARENRRQEAALKRARLFYTLTHFGQSDENKTKESSGGAGSAAGQEEGQEYYENCLTRLFRSNPRFRARTTSAGPGDIELGAAAQREGGDDSDLVDAAKFSHAHGFISTFSNQYHTVISTMGSGYMISGGQKQRISVARAMLKQPKILLLDEATSALDSQSEQLVQQSIDALTNRGPRRNPVREASSAGGNSPKPELNPQTSSLFSANLRPTVIIVAHRLSTIVNADRIIVIDKGEVKEQGPHEELMAIPNGLYRALYMKQASGGSAH